MTFIQNQIQKRSIFILMLITLLCVTTVVYAGIWGLLWAIAGGIGTVITYHGCVKSLKKDLDEKIKILEDDLLTLDAQKKKAWKEFWMWNDLLIMNTLALESAEIALTAAKQAVVDAKSAVSIAENKHQTTKEDTQKKNNAYHYHVHYCEWCDDSSLCSEGSRLHTEWQQWESKTAEAYKAIGTVEEAVKTKENEEKDAKILVVYRRRTKKTTENYANSILSIARNYTKRVKDTGDKLKAKRIESAIYEAKILEALGKISAAKQELEDVRTKFPDAWQEALDADPVLKEEVEKILNYEEEIVNNEE